MWYCLRLCVLIVILGYLFSAPAWGEEEEPENESDEKEEEVYRGAQRNHLVLVLEESEDLKNWTPVEVDRVQIDRGAIIVEKAGARKFWRMNIHASYENEEWELWPGTLTLNRDSETVWLELDVLTDYWPALASSVRHVREHVRSQPVGMPEIDDLVEEVFSSAISRIEGGLLERGDTLRINRDVVLPEEEEEDEDPEEEPNENGDNEDS